MSGQHPDACEYVLSCGVQTQTHRGQLNVSCSLALAIVLVSIIKWDCFSFLGLLRDVYKNVKVARAWKESISCSVYKVRCEHGMRVIQGGQQS